MTTEQITPAKPAKKLSCEEQTWPYIDNRCIARKVTRAASLRALCGSSTAPRDGDGGIAGGNGPKLITSDGVLRGPGVAPEAEAPKAKPVTPTVKKARNVPTGDKTVTKPASGLFGPVGGESTKPVIVVRPLRIEQYSSRY